MLLAFLLACPSFGTNTPLSDDTAADAGADDTLTAEEWWGSFYDLVCERTWACDATDMSTVSDFGSADECRAYFASTESPACADFDPGRGRACLDDYAAWSCEQVREDYLPVSCGLVCGTP